MLDFQCAHDHCSGYFFFPSQHPFSEENFAELLYAVRLLENSRDPEVFKTEYMFVVHSYFEQFTTKVSNENKTITPEVILLLTHNYKCAYFMLLCFSFDSC